MTDKELLKKALHRIEYHYEGDPDGKEAIEAIKARLAQPESRVTEDMWKKLSELQQKVMEIAHTAPPKKEWVGLTETEKELLWDEAVDGREHFCSQYGNFADAIETKLKEKNT